MYRLHPYTCFQEDDVMHLARSKEDLVERSRPPFDAGRKLSEIDKALLWQLLNEAPECPSRELLVKATQRQVLVPVSIRHLNRLRVQWTLNRPKGRPRHAVGRLPVASGAEVAHKRQTGYDADDLCARGHRQTAHSVARTALGPIECPLHPQPIEMADAHRHQHLPLGGLCEQLTARALRGLVEQLPQ